VQDSIGGNAKTIIVANVSPSEACLQETVSTLKFATRARNLVNKVCMVARRSADECSTAASIHADGPAHRFDSTSLVSQRFESHVHRLLHLRV
jgi:hypothetical protein